MKIRMTILTENNAPRPSGLSTETVAAAWQAIFNCVCLSSDNEDKAIVEKVEFVEEDNA